MKKGFLFIAALTLLLTGCLKDDMSQGTIVLMGTESYVKSIEEVIPDTLLRFIADTTVMGDETIVLPRGNTPPDIQGEYMFFPRELYKDNGHHPLAGDTLFFRFGGHQPIDTLLYYPQGQHNRVAPGDIHEKGFLQEKIDTVYLMGEGTRFTAYFKVAYKNCYEPMSHLYYTLTRGYVITGTVAESGIANAIVACVNISAEPNTPSQFIPFDSFERYMVNRIYIYRVQSNGQNPFGSAVRQKWYQN